MDFVITVKMVVRNLCNKEDLKDYGVKLPSGKYLVSPELDLVNKMIESEGLHGIIDDRMTLVVSATELD